MRDIVDEALEEPVGEDSLLTVSNPYDTGFEGSKGPEDSGHETRREAVEDMVYDLERQALDYGAQGVLVMGDATPYHAEQFMDMQDEGELPWYYVPGPGTVSSVYPSFTGPSGAEDATRGFESTMEWWENTSQEYPGYVDTVSERIRDSLDDKGEGTTNSSISFDLDSGGSVLFSNSLAAPVGSHGVREEALNWVDLESTGTGVIEKNAELMEDYGIDTMIRPGTNGSKGHLWPVDSFADGYAVGKGSRAGRNWEEGRVPDGFHDMGIATLPDVSQSGVYETVFYEDHVEVKSTDTEVDMGIDWDDYLSRGSFSEETSSTNPVVMAFADVHGHYSELDGAIEAAEKYMMDAGLVSGPVSIENRPLEGPRYLEPGEAVTDGDVHIVANGDLVDRGRENEAVMKSMLSMVDQAPESVDWVLGNHTEFMALPHRRLQMYDGDPDRMLAQKSEDEVYWWTMDEGYRERFLDHMREGNVVAGFSSYSGYKIQHASTADIDIESLNRDIRKSGELLLEAHGTEDWEEIQRRVHERDLLETEIEGRILDPLYGDSIAWTRMPENEGLKENRTMVGHDQVSYVPGEKNRGHRDFQDLEIEDTRGKGPQGWSEDANSRFPPIRYGESLNMNVFRSNGGVEGGGAVILHHPDGLPDGEIVAIQDMGGGPHNYRAIPFDHLPEIREKDGSFDVVS